MIILIFCCFLAAFLPCALFLHNLREYRPLPAGSFSRETISVLIPARNEERNIGAALESILSSDAVELEVIVLDDDSSDGTRRIIEKIAARDERVRILQGQPLPSHWRGKPFACQQLAAAATAPILIFLDADVRVTQRDSLARAVEFMRNTGVALASGVPRQITKTWFEKMIVPLIYFILLSFLPLRRMRAGSDTRFAAACGQLVVVDREAYLASGGHRNIAEFMHDGIALARRLRAAGYRTDLFDATDTFSCRMYRSAIEVWNGFAKNAQEGLGAPGLIVPATIALLLGQVAPFVLAAFPQHLSLGKLIIVSSAAICALLPRLIAAARFHQSFISVLFHPFGIASLLSIQWWTRLRTLSGSAMTWKGRPVIKPPAAVVSQ